MKALLDKEARRIERQAQLDQQKTAAERNKWGQFATPPRLALEIAEYARKRFARRKGTISFLDPAIGTGSFFSALLQRVPDKRLSTARGVELDSAFADTARTLWQDSGLQVTNGDFTVLQPQEGERFNLILTNPPYVRHHHIGSTAKARLGSQVERLLGIRISGLAGLYCYFLLLADAWLADNGLALWLIPSEFMDVNYGKALKTYLTEHVTLRQIHRFAPSDVQFADALVSSAVVVFEKTPPKRNHKARFTFSGLLAKPAMEEQVTVETLKHSPKWTNYPHRSGARRAPHNGEPTLGDLFTVKRGIATGCNRFFILPRRDAIERGIPAEYLRPILPSPRHLRQGIIEADIEGFPILDTQLVVIDCHLPESEVRATCPAFWKYLQEGRSAGLHTRYLASRREPWYMQEQRKPAPFLCTYMGRSQQRPFRFIWNKSQAIAANVYLLLYPRVLLSEKLANQPTLCERVYASLANIEPQSFFMEGRVYGGGLHKMEPAELMRLPIADLAGLLDIESQRRLFADGEEYARS